MPRQRSKIPKERTKIPFEISFAVGFLDEDLSEAQWEREVRKIVREKLPTLGEEKESEYGDLFEEYDAELARIIAEESARN